jgi:hypothetical protein
MADVIDSFKRLERVGSENSKTTQKLIDAATELSSVIARQFAVGPDDETISIKKIEEEAGVHPEFEPLHVTKFHYVIRPNGYGGGDLHLLQ